MKTKKKLLIALLSTTVMVAGAVGFAACGEAGEKGEQGEKGEAGKSAYQVYADAETAAGRTPKTEAEWLISLIGEKGEDGKSAYELYADAETKAGRTPKSESEWLVSLIGKDGQAGKGVKSVELTGDKKGLLITYSDNTTETVILPEEITHVHTYGDDYSVVLPATLENDGLGYLTCTSDTCDHKELVVLPQLTLPDSGDGSYLDPFVLGKGLKIGDKASYKLTIEGAFNEMWYQFLWDANLSFLGDETGEESVFYEVTINSEYVTYNQNYTAVRKFLLIVEEEYMDVSLDVEATDYEDAGEYTFTVTVERTNPPAIGSVYNPAPVKVGEKTVFEAEADTDVYFSLDLTSKDDSSNYQVTFDESNMKLSWLGSDINGDRSDELVDGDSKSMGYWNTYYYKASAKDGKIEFTVDLVILPGEKENPIEVVLGETKTTKSDNWYSFTAAEAGKYTVSSSGSSVYYYFYNSKEDIENYNSVTVEKGGKYIFEAEAGKTYYINAQAEFDFNVKAFNTETDAGYSAAVPKTVTAGNISLTATDDMYYAYTAEKDGLFFVVGTNVTFSVYNNADFKAYGDNNERLFYYLSDDLCVEVKEGDVLYFTASAIEITETLTSGSVVVGVNDEETPAAVAYTFTVVDEDGEALPAGVKVTATKDETVVEGTTTEGGKVTLNLVPDKYTITVDFGSVTGYSYVNKVTTAKCFGANETKVEVAKNRTYTVTVKHKGEVVKGLTVMLGNYTAVTNEQGVATFSVPDSTYTVSIVNAEGAEDPYVIDGNLQLYGSQYGAERDGELKVLLDSEVLKLEEITVSKTQAVVKQATEEAGFKFTSLDGYDFNFKVENGHIETLKISGQTKIINGINQDGSNTDVTPMFYGPSPVEIIIVPDEGKTATLIITAISWD